jgi:transposase InsO family protein
VFGDRRRRRHPVGARDRGPGAARERARSAPVLALGQWARVRRDRHSRLAQTAQIETAFIDPGKPWQNGTDESFNGKFRNEYLSLNWLRNRIEATVGIEQWRRHYNEVRPHSSLGYLTPLEFKATWSADRDGGHSPASPARADEEEPRQEPDEPTTLINQPTGAILQ